MVVDNTDENSHVELHLCLTPDLDSGKAWLRLPRSDCYTYHHLHWQDPAHTIQKQDHVSSLSSVRRSSSLDWKKDRNRTEPNCKRPDHWLRLHKFWIFSVASCDVCQKIEKPKKTGLDRLQPVFRPVMCLTLLTHIFSLIVGLWIIKNGQELVEI